MSAIVSNYRSSGLEIDSGVQAPSKIKTLENINDLTKYLSKEKYEGYTFLFDVDDTLIGNMSIPGSLHWRAWVKRAKLSEDEYAQITLYLAKKSSL